MTFQECRLLIFFKVTFFRKITKKNQEYFQYQTVWIQIRSNVFLALFARNVKPDLDPKLFLVDTSRWIVNRLLHFCCILFALTMSALNGFFLPIRCINFGMVHYIYRGVTAYNFQIKLHFFLGVPLFHTYSKQCRPWWNASFRLGFTVWQMGHIYAKSVEMVHQLFFETKIYLLNSHPPSPKKSVRLSIFIMCVWEKWSLTNAEVQSFAAKDYKCMSWATWPFWFYHNQS